MSLSNAPIGRLVATLERLPHRRLRLFRLLPVLYREGQLDEAAVVRLAPDVEPAVSEVEAYIRAVADFNRQLLATLDHTG